MLRRYSANGMETLPLDKTVISIGSGPDCDIVIPDPNLAQKHAEIEYHPLPQAYFLKDLDTLSGTTFNGEPVYGMVELKPNNTIRFGYGPEYVFELPKVTSKGNIRKITKGHENCLTAKESTVSLPVVGRKILPALPTKQYSHPPPRPRKVRLSMDDPRTPSEEKEKRSFLTTERLSPISRVRSASMDPSISKNYNSILHKTSEPHNRFIGGIRKSENGKVGSKSEFPKNYGMTSPTSSANSSAEISTNRRNTVLGTPLNCDYTLSTNNNLLQRVVRLQMELHRRDLEINHLRERILQNSAPNEGSRVDSAFSFSEADVQKPINSRSRSPSDILLSSHSAVHKTTNVFDITQSRTLEMEIEIGNDFLRLLTQSMQKLNERLLTFPMRDYADIFSEMTRCLIDPLSCTVTDTQKQCIENINKRYILISERQIAQHLLEKYMQESVQPLVRQIEMILPVVRDAAMIARESVKVCTVFTAWSREFGDEIRTNGLTSSMLLHKADALLSRFKENSLGKHWLPPSLTPLLRVASLEFRKRIESRTVSTKETTSIPSQTDYNWNEIWDKRELVNNETKDVETIEMIEKSSEEVDTDSIVARLEESARKSPSKDGNSWEEQKAICAIKSEKGEVERASFSKDEREEDSSLEDGIHSISTAPPSVCSSQKTSTDTEQLDHLHELARNIRDVFQKLDLQAEMSGDEGGVLKSNVAQNEDSCGTDTPPSTPVEPISGSPPAEMLRQDGHDTNEQLQPAMKKNSMEDDSSSTVSISLPTIISKSIDVVESKCVDTEEPVEDDLPLPSVTKHKTLGDDLSLLSTEPNTLNLDYISTVRSDAPSRLTHRSEHHSELDEPITGEDTGKRKGSSEFWRLATNLGRALALEQEINKTREENLRESEKRASVMESLMIGIHEILENIKTEHEKLDAESN
ncbi:hypothetical protein QR680_001587 [Steinernema hermaphroditum]|uniref:FHA domain-containing protein n=1 Tax=Steinernema hermaphroditum TaxID=289476 RepID=A0AA39LG88_9BILA|nr:hypothetical protein QR680_001587 [Steinernema hermaphroditum]